MFESEREKKREENTKTRKRVGEDNKWGGNWIWDREQREREIEKSSSKKVETGREREEMFQGTYVCICNIWMYVYMHIYTVQYTQRREKNKQTNEKKGRHHDDERGRRTRLKFILCIMELGSQPALASLEKIFFRDRWNCPVGMCTYSKRRRWKRKKKTRQERKNKETRDNKTN